MKLLIVDDEKHVITAVRCLVPAKELGITDILSAQTSAEAKTILEKEKPEIAVVDIILQNQTGMNLMAFILNKKLPTKVIALSGHSDYEYVRTMLLNGAVDYLLKPVEAKALVSALKKAIALAAPAIEDSPEQQPAMSMNLSTQYMRMLLRKMLIPAHEQKAYSELQALDSQFAGLQHCVLLYYDLEYLPMRSSSFRQHLNMFEEKAKSYLSLHRCGFFLDKFNSQHERLILLLDEDAGHKRQIESIAATAFSSAVSAFHMGCISRAEFPAEFRKGFIQAKSSFFADDCLMTPELIQERPDAGPFVPLKMPPELERRLLSLIVAQDTSGLLAAAEDWLNAALSEDTLPLSLVRRVIEQYNAMYARWVARIRDRFPGFSVSNATERVRYADFLDEHFSFSLPMLSAGILRSLRLFTERVGKGCLKQDVFRQIAFYMELNYDLPFHQAEYARLFHLNKDYLSRKFKQVFDEGMIAYMNRLRITHAEDMLRDPKLKIRDIAFLTGFGDEKYFTRQFKAFRQMTPSEYRAILNLEEE